ncbi:MAG: hypothetical protein QS2022_8400 [Candidatus Phytoplasma asteris]|uniref:Uncharacterized protein n=1 Tax='Chrysanthemum coronarium' phytoplasma TaxID=1520703 RepID=A0ABQ0J3V5_9MOLU|nr:hypothetical protein ['Chrysanthemum coronarium' phytoplasma]TKA87685.1 MAG: hypothetical protein PLY_8350 [Periwinkle leaf yellowing phytoplasma]WEX20048.1 MAG: hypothetical protein QS2022_8400 [Candidatus Phytoplasma asteris]GAK74254.1 hypothetical protein OYV_07540 ['Chrysanthemum coronarium' phytoplasma]
MQKKNYNKKKIIGIIFFTKPNFVTEFAQKYIKYHYFPIDVKNNNSTNLIKKVEDIKKIFYNKITSSNNNTGLCIEAENQIYYINDFPPLSQIQKITPNLLKKPVLLEKIEIV